jgi:hypothetical protein
MFLIICKFAACVVLILSISEPGGAVCRNLWWFICGVTVFAGNGAHDAELDGPYKTSLVYWYRGFYVAALLYNPIIKIGFDHSVWSRLHLGLALSLVYSVFKIDFVTAHINVDSNWYKDFFNPIYSPIYSSKYELNLEHAAAFIQEQGNVVKSYSRLHCYSTITPAAAACLSSYVGNLDLIGLDRLDAATATALSNHYGELNLSGLNSIDEPVAAALVNHNGNIKFNKNVEEYIQKMSTYSDSSGFARLALKLYN